MSRRMRVFIALAALSVASSAWAHHNMSAVFDFNDRVSLTGTLTKIDWRNPHIYVFVDAVTAGGQVEAWSIEGPPPIFFRTREINRSDFEQAIGKTIKAEASRARDGSRSGLIRFITLPDGKMVSACPQNC